MMKITIMANTKHMVNSMENRKKRKAVAKKEATRNPTIINKNLERKDTRTRVMKKKRVQVMNLRKVTMIITVMKRSMVRKKAESQLRNGDTAKAASIEPSEHLLKVVSAIRYHRNRGSGKIFPSLIFVMCPATDRFLTSSEIDMSQSFSNLSVLINFLFPSSQCLNMKLVSFFSFIICGFIFSLTFFYASNTCKTLGISCLPFFSSKNFFFSLLLVGFQQYKFILK